MQLRNLQQLIPLPQKRQMVRPVTQKGFSLLELMIGLTIGLVVSLVASNSLIFTSNTQKTVSEATSLQQQASVVMRMVGSMLRQAGGADFAPPPYIDGLVVFSNTYNGYAASNKDISGLDGGTSSDTLRISTIDTVSAGVSLTRDCLGNATSFTGNRIDNQLSVDAAKNLVCLGSGSATPQAIADGVEDFQVRYAVAASNDAGITQKIQYFNANPAWSASDWRKVRAVEVCLRLSQSSTQNAGGGSIVQGCDGNNVAADGKMRRVFRNTFFLRNSFKAT